MRRAVVGSAAAALVALSSLAVSTSSAQVLGLPAAARAIRGSVKQHFPAAHDVFANCPGDNRVAAGLNCEFRFLIHGAVRIGAAIAEEEDGRWSTPGLLVGHAVSHRPHRCSLRGLGQTAYPLRLVTFSVGCGYAHRAAREFMAYALAHNLRLPRKFGYSLEGRGETLGFIIRRFGCSAHISIRGGAGPGNPYGHEVARCRNRFGDRFLFAFDQGS